MTTIDNVYAQRNELAVAFAKAALAAGWKAGRGIDSKADPEWANVVYVDLPDGRQVSWHISPDCAPLLDGLPQYAGTWDGTFIGRETGWSRGIEVVAQQAEPLNLSDPAVRKRLASQWGYVPAAQAEPVEPVAVVATQSDVWRGYNGQWAPPGEPTKMAMLLRDLPIGTLLYTAPPPPQRKPLTLEEIYHATGHCGVSKYTAVNITRVVERAHGIKE